MPKLKVVKQYNASSGQKEKIYPITIVKGIYDTDNSQPLADTLSDKVDSTTLATILDSMSMDADTGELVIQYNL